LKKLVFLALALVLVFSGILVGCGSSETVTTTATTTTTTTSQPSPTTTTSQPSPTMTTTTATNPLGGLAKPAGGKEGGRLQLVGSGNIANIGDPNAISNPGDAAYSFPVIEPLVIIGADGNIAPWLAERFEIAEDGSHIMLYLRHGVMFTDGTPFDATAAKYNLDNGINSEVWPNMKTCSSAEIIDDYTVKLNFVDGKFDWGATKSMAGFFSVRMFSPTALEANDDDWKRTHVVGTGPFVLTSFERDQKLAYDRNEDYWRGAPYLEGIDYNIIPDPTTQLLAYKAGDVDTIGVQASDAQDLLDSGFDIAESTDVVYNQCLIPSSNNPDSPLANVYARRAVECAIDKQALVDGLTYGYGHTSNQNWVDFQPEWDPTVVGNPFDLDKAQEYLDMAGYSDGFTTAIWLVDFLPLDLPLALQDMLAKVNITVEFEQVSIVQLNEMVALGGQGWEGFMYSIGVVGTTVDPASSLINGPLNGTTTWISCNEPDDLLALASQAAGETDPDTRITLYQELSKKMEDDYCMWIFMYWSPTLSSVSPKVKGYTIGQYTEPFVWTFAWLDE
jgi:ABC-type transport system substrate-binding protein